MYELPPKIVESLIQSMNEALVAYGTLESRIGMGSALCESSFYMPMLKVAKHLGWESQIEMAVQSLKASKFGDVPRIDFYGHRQGYGVAIELKFKDKFIASEPYPKFEVEKSHRKPKKPTEIKRYELMLKKATLAETKAENYKRNQLIGKRMSDHAEHLLEETLEYAVEIGGQGQRLAEWFGGVVDPKTTLSLATMPRIRTSKSHWNAVGKNDLSIRNIKILAIEKALDKHNVNDELDDAMEAI